MYLFLYLFVYIPDIKLNCLIALASAFIYKTEAKLKVSKETPRSVCPALKIGHLQKQFVQALFANVNRKGQASKQNKHSEEHEEQNGGRTTETARDLRQWHGHGHGLVGRRVVTFNSRRELCKHGKGKNEEDDDVDNEVDDDDNVTSEGEEEKENAKRWPLEVVMRSGHSCFSLRVCV